MAITGLPTSVTAFVGPATNGPVDTPVPISSFAAFEAQFGGLSHDSPMSYAVAQFFASGGREARVVRAADAGRGLDSLEEGGGFNLICVPPPSFDSDISSSTRAHAARLAARCRAIFVADSLRAWRDPEDLSDPTHGLDSNLWGIDSSVRANVACYFPRVRVPDPLRGGTPGEFVPCGLVAGVYARTDRERGVWRAPAGVDATLPSVAELVTTLSAVQHEQLTARGVNGLRRVSGGHVVWGSRTLHNDVSRDTEWKYIPVRRLFLFLEQSIEHGLQWALFEPNNEALWARIRTEAADFMQTLFRQGALQGRSPQDAWFVKCGPDTTTQDELDAGIVNVVVGFAPLKPAEFVVISIRLLVGGSGGGGERYRG